MGRFQKTFTQSYLDGENDATNRMIKRLEKAEKEGCRGESLDLMRTWMLGGFLMEEIGKGLCDSIITMDQEGVFDSMSHEQQSGVLIKLIEHKVWQYQLMESARSAKPDEVITAKVAEPTKKDIQKNEFTEVPMVEPKPRKKKKRVANILA